MRLAPRDREVRVTYARRLPGMLTAGTRLAPERTAQARRQAEMAVSLDPASFAAQVALADFLRTQALIRDEAIRRLRALTTLWPNHAEAHRSLGMALFVNGQDEESCNALERFSALSGGSHLAHWLRDLSLEGLRRYAESLAALDRAIELRPDFSHDRVLKDYRALLMGNLPLAGATLDAIPAAALLNAEPLHIATWVRLWNGKAAEALRLARSFKATCVDSNFFFGTTGLRRGLALLCQQRPEAARTAFAAAAQAVEERLGRQQNDKMLRGWKAIPASRPGDAATARTALQVYWEQPWAEKPGPGWAQFELRVVTALLRSDGRVWLSGNWPAIATGWARRGTLTLIRNSMAFARCPGVMAVRQGQRKTTAGHDEAKP